MDSYFAVVAAFTRVLERLSGFDLLLKDRPGFSALFRQQPLASFGHRRMPFLLRPGFRERLRQDNTLWSLQMALLECAQAQTSCDGVGFRVRTRWRP